MATEVPSPKIPNTAIVATRQPSGDGQPEDAVDVEVEGTTVPTTAQVKGSSKWPRGGVNRLFSKI